MCDCGCGGNCGGSCGGNCGQPTKIITKETIVDVVGIRTLSSLIGQDTNNRFAGNGGATFQVMYTYVIPANFWKNSRGIRAEFKGSGILSNGSGCTVNFYLENATAGKKIVGGGATGAISNTAAIDITVDMERLSASQSIIGTSDPAKSIVAFSRRIFGEDTISPSAVVTNTSFNPVNMDTFAEDITLTIELELVNASDYVDIDIIKILSI